MVLAPRRGVNASQAEVVVVGGKAVSGSFPHDMRLYSIRSDLSVFEDLFLSAPNLLKVPILRCRDLFVVETDSRIVIILCPACTHWHSACRAARKRVQRVCRRDTAATPRPRLLRIRVAACASPCTFGSRAAGPTSDPVPTRAPCHLVLRDIGCGESRPTCERGGRTRPGQEMHAQFSFEHLVGTPAFC